MPLIDDAALTRLKDLLETVLPRVTDVILTERYESAGNTERVVGQRLTLEISYKPPAK